MKKVIKPVIVVEGTSDVNKLRLLVDADFVITNGSEVSRETLEYIKELSKDRQIIVMTDPDYPGTRIRNIVNSFVPGCFNAFVDKEKSIKHHKVGVAECDKNEILRALENMIEYKEVEVEDRLLDEKDIFELKLNGHSSSSYLRDYVSKHYNLGKVNAKTLLKRLNMLNVTKEELKGVLDSYDHQ